MPVPTADANEAGYDAPARGPGAAPETATRAQAPRSAQITGEFISRILSVGVSSSCDHLKRTLTASIAEKGDAYFSDAIERARGSAQRLVGWGRQHPIQAACALTAAFGVAAIALAVVQNRRHPPAEAAESTDLPPPLMASSETLPNGPEADVAVSRQ